MRKWIICIASLLVGVAGITLYYEGYFGDHPKLISTSFECLPGWDQDDQSKALIAFQYSCEEILKRPPGAAFSSAIRAGHVSDWQIVCLNAKKVKPDDRLAAKKFFESWFTPYLVINHLNSKGLFTGYYLPLLQGTLKKDKAQQVPVFERPDDLIKMNPNNFGISLLGKKIIIGQLKNQELFPYPDRKEIDKGAIASKHIIAWCDDPIDLFFAQIQGSALMELPNQQKILLGYAGGNGQPYTSIGKILIERNQLTKETVSLQSIRAWLQSHPSEIKAVLEKNASYVFFRKLSNQSPLGTEQVELTPERSLAVDTTFIPLGTPAWLVTEIPTMKNGVIPFKQLVITQDTGGAIKGVVRGDIYWGPGAEAEFIAGHAKNRGEYWVFLPKISQV